MRKRSGPKQDAKSFVSGQVLWKLHNCRGQRLSEMKSYSNTQTTFTFSTPVPVRDSDSVLLMNRSSHTEIRQKILKKQKKNTSNKQAEFPTLGEEAVRGGI